MNEKKLPDVKLPAEIRPNSRDLGFVLIGIALGIPWGSAVPYPAILILAMGLAMTGCHFIYKSRGR
jgi:hypothetical protein